jgi:hypothetical protein
MTTSEIQKRFAEIKNRHADSLTDIQQELDNIFNNRDDLDDFKESIGYIKYLINEIDNDIFDETIKN